MAAPMALVDVIEKKAREFFHQEAASVKKISVIRKSERFSDGDIVIPAGCLGNVETKILCKLRETIFEGLKLCGQPVTKVGGEESNSVGVYLDRGRVFRETVSLVIKEKDKYGSNRDKKDEAILLCNDILFMNTADENSGDVSLESLRSLVMHDHISHLLYSQSYNVSSPVERAAFGNYKSLFSLFGTDLSSFKDVSVDTEKEKPLITDFLNCPYVKKSKDLKIIRTFKDETTCESVEKETNDDPEHVYEFDMKRLIQEKGLNIGKTGFDKNLSLCAVFSSGSPTEVLKRTLLIYNSVKERQAQFCIHITGQRHAYSVQKTHLILQELGEMENTKISQNHFVYGPVVPRQESKEQDTVNVDVLFRMRYAQLRQAAVMKYGEGVHGEGWAATLEALTAACIKFEMLSCVHRNTLKLNVCEDDMEGTATTAGSFVMYNCARLATLFKHFQTEVDRGTYPPMPSLDDVDFSTLREEAEWSLLFNYVYTFPKLLEQTLQTFDDSDTIYATIHTHKVCQMLCSLSRCLSSYYSRYHVLGEPRVQLLPTMYARLYLLKAVHQVMINGLALMGIQPISQL